MSSVPLPPTTYDGTTYANYWGYAISYGLEPITPVGVFYSNELGSVLVSRDVASSGQLADQLKTRLDDCAAIGKCGSLQLYNCITGNINAPQDPNVSIGPHFRDAMHHFVFGGNWSKEVEKSFYTLGENSYFSESSYYMEGDSWKQRYWGDNYQKLLDVKQKWDPNNVFWCRHCVGSDL